MEAFLSLIHSLWLNLRTSLVQIDERQWTKLCHVTTPNCESDWEMKCSHVPKKKTMLMSDTEAEVSETDPDLATNPWFHQCVYLT